MGDIILHDDVKYLKLDDFTDGELNEIINDALRHRANPKHFFHNHVNHDRIAIDYELYNYDINIRLLSKEDDERIDKLYKAIIESA